MIELDDIVFEEKQPLDVKLDAIVDTKSEVDTEPSTPVYTAIIPKDMKKKCRRVWTAFGFGHEFVSFFKP